MLTKSIYGSYIYALYTYVTIYTFYINAEKREKVNKLIKLNCGVFSFIMDIFLEQTWKIMDILKIIETFS